MMKILLLGLLFAIFYFVYIPKPSEHCPFCDPNIVNKQNYYEDDYVFGLYNYKPLVEGHMLIIPKRHVERFEDLTYLEMVKIQKLIQKTHRAALKAFGKENYLILQKNGTEVGQSVPHVHFHYIPKQGGSPFQLLLRFLFSPLKSEIPLTELKEKIARIRQFWEGEPSPVGVQI